MVSCSLPVKTAEGMISPNIKTRETDSTTANQDLRFFANMKGEQKSIESEIDTAGSPMSTKRPGSLLDQNPSLFGNQCHYIWSFEHAFQQAEAMSFQWQVHKGPSWNHTPRVIPGILKETTVAWYNYLATFPVRTVAAHNQQFFTSSCMNRSTS